MIRKKKVWQKKYDRKKNKQYQVRDEISNSFQVCFRLVDNLFLALSLCIKILIQRRYDILTHKR